MDKPILSWTDGTLAALTKLQFSSVAGSMQAIVADTESLVTTVAVTNNFTLGTPAAVALMDATDCKLKITATDGTTNAPAVLEKWISAKCTTAGQTEYTRIGYDTLTTTETTLSISAGDATKVNTIVGAANAGTEVDGLAKFNIAKVDLKCKPDLNTVATGGIQSMRLVLVYSYGAV